MGTARLSWVLTVYSVSLSADLKQILGVKSGHSDFGTGLPPDVCPSFFS